MIWVKIAYVDVHNRNPQTAWKLQIDLPGGT